VRVIAATNRDLERAVAQGQFREDLLFRLNVVTIALPPLRERREEIPRFAVHFLRKYSVQYNRACSEISDDTLRLFVEHDWPGNVRELENVIKRLVILGSETPVQQELARAMTARLVGLAPSGRSGSLPPPEPPSRAAAPPAHPAPPSPVPASGNGGEGHYSLKDIARTAAREAERELISRMLQHTRWNRKETAEMLGISYKALLYKIKENGLDKAPTL
jgi:two-component system response regulator AtoC